MTRVAATGRIDPDGSYVDLQTYPGMDVWTHVVPTTNSQVLFFNSVTGGAVFGGIDARAGSRTGHSCNWTATGGTS